MTRIGMNIYIAAREPKLTLNGWKHVAEALAIGERKAKELAGGPAPSRPRSVPTTLADIVGNPTMCPTSPAEPL